MDKKFTISVERTKQVRQYEPLRVSIIHDITVDIDNEDETLAYIEAFSNHLKDLVNRVVDGSPVDLPFPVNKEYSDF